MLCPRCGKENAVEVTTCSACGAQLWQPGGQPRVPSRTSGLAIASLVIAIIGLLTIAVPVLVALPLGIIALVQIGRSQGRLSGKGLAIGGICVSGCSLLLLPVIAAMVFPVFVRARESARKVQCLANLKTLATAMQMYRQDWGRWPDGAAWCDVIGEYTPRAEAYHCPSASGLPCGYAYNAALTGLEAASLASPEQTVALFESDHGWNAAGDQSLLCPEPRHLGGDNWAFADGRAQWLSRSEAPAATTWEAQGDR